MEKQTEDIIIEVADYIESLPDGIRISTFQILEQIYHDDAFFLDELQIHAGVFDEIMRRGHIVLDMSEYEGKLAGLPQHLPFTVRRND